MSIVVTGATGQLGRAVIQSLLNKKAEPSQIIAAVRSPDRAADLAALGVVVRKADYTDPASLDSAFQGAQKILLISANEIGKRVEQHRNVIDAAKRAAVGLVVYTSLLRADSTPLGLGAEHTATEIALKESGLPFIILRNGWYTENYLASIDAALQHNALVGSAGEGKISSATREDYAEAAATVLLHSQDHIGQIYELGGDEAYTLTEFAQALSKAAGKDIPFVNLPKEQYKAILVQQAGLPEFLGELLADSDAGAAQGGLYEAGGVLRQLIGRPTTPLVVALEAHLKSKEAAAKK